MLNRLVVRSPNLYVIKNFPTKVQGQIASWVNSTTKDSEKNKNPLKLSQKTGGQNFSKLIYETSITIVKKTSGDTEKIKLQE